MLVLSRDPGHSVIVGGNIKITVLKVRGNQVVLAFQAPSEVKIVREELLEKEEIQKKI